MKRSTTAKLPKKTSAKVPTSIRLNKSEEDRLDKLVQKTGRTKAFYLRELVERGLQDLENYYLANEVFKRVQQGEEEVLSSEQVKKIHNPPHPGEVLKEYLGDITVTQAALKMGVNRVTLSRIISGGAGISADMAYRLASAFGTSPELWAGMQLQYDLFVASKLKRPKIQRLAFA